VNAWHLDNTGMVQVQSARNAAAGAPARTPASGWNCWSAMAKMIRRVAVHWRGERAPLEIPQAVGATDRELERLGPDPMLRLTDQLRYSHPQRLYLTVARYE
jgi:hypothetical protein